MKKKSDRVSCNPQIAKDDQMSYIDELFFGREHFRYNRLLIRIFDSRLYSGISIYSHMLCSISVLQICRFLYS